MSWLSIVVHPWANPGFRSFDKLPCCHIIIVLGAVRENYGLPSRWLVGGLVRRIIREPRGGPERKQAGPERSHTQI